MSNIVFDSHCHPQMEQYNSDRDEMIRRALDAGISMICVGTDLETSRKGIELAQKYAGMWATVGLHPNDAVNDLRFTIYEYEELLKENKIVAIGEIGLDYYRTPEPDKQEEQKKVFGNFLDLAIKHDKPVIIHSRDAAKGSTGKVHKDLLAILNTKYLIHNTNLRGVAHSFTGGIEEARKYLDLGFYLGFNGILTFARQYDEVVKYAPLDRILLETDAPFLAPEPYRGKRNEPFYVVEVAKKIAELKNETLEKITDQTTENCKKLFGLL